VRSAKKKVGKRVPQKTKYRGSQGRKQKRQAEINRRGKTKKNGSIPRKLDEERTIIIEGKKRTKGAMHRSTQVHLGRDGKKKTAVGKEKSANSKKKDETGVGKKRTQRPGGSALMAGLKFPFCGRERKRGEGSGEKRAPREVTRSG